MEPIVFKHENYNIASDIRLEADVVYIQGHPIVKTKTVVLYYRDSTFRASTYGSSFTNALIKDAARPQYTVELINYLSRIVNHDNLFEVYAKNINVERYTLEELTFANSENDEQRRSPLLDKTEYSEGLLDDKARFILKELMKTINVRFSYTFPSIEELDYVPICGYISTSGKLNGNWKAEPILHLAVIFNVLAHQDRFSDINNQEAIASFNSIMKAKRLNIAAQSLNEHEYKNEIKRLKLELQREHERANGLEIAKKTLEEKIEEMNNKLDTQTQALNDANAKLDTQTQELAQAQVSLNEANAKLDASAQREEQLQNTMNQLQDVIVESAQTLHDELHAAGEMVREQFTRMNVTTSSRAETIDVWKIRALDEYYHRTHQCEENERVLDTYCGDASKPSRINQHRFKPQDTDELIGSYPNANAIDLAVYLRRHHAEYPHVRMDSNRKLIYIEDYILEVKSLLESYSDDGDGRIIEVVDSFELKSQNAGNQMIAHLQAIFNQQQAQAQQLEAINEHVEQLEAQIEAHHQEQQQANVHIQAQLDNIQEQLTSYQLFKQKHPHARQHLHRRWYRDVNEDEEGRAWCEDLKGGARYYLTEDDINRGRFR